MKNRFSQFWWCAYLSRRRSIDWHTNAPCSYFALWERQRETSTVIAPLLLWMEFRGSWNEIHTTERCSVRTYVRAVYIFTRKIDQCPCCNLASERRDSGDFRTFCATLFASAAPNYIGRAQCWYTQRARKLTPLTRQHGWKRWEVYVYNRARRFWQIFEVRICHLKNFWLATWRMLF